MIAVTKMKIGSLLLSFTLAVVEMPGAFSYELTTSDMAAYRSDVIRRVFDAVKVSSEFKRTVIDLNINAMGKITSCRVVKSSGDPNLDSKMMQALSQVSLEPMKFASSNSDSIQIQISFANAVPDPKNLYIAENEAFSYRGLGTMMRIGGSATTPALSGPPNILQSMRRRILTGERSRLESAGEHTQSASSGEQVVSAPSRDSAKSAPPENYGKNDKNYDDEISKLLSDTLPEMTFHFVRFGLLDAPPSDVLVDQAMALTNKGHCLQAAQSYIVALIEPIRNQKLESVTPITDKLSKLNAKLSGDERLNVAISLLNFHHRVKGMLPFHVTEQLKGVLYTVIPLAQQFADDCHTKKLGRLARYYRLRGEIFKGTNELDKAKVAYQKYLSITLENDDALPSEVEQAFEKTLESLHSREDQNAIHEVETQRQVWLSKHQDPTNLRAITSACSQLESNLSRFPSYQTASSETDEAIKRILKLIQTSSLSTQPVPERFFPPGEFLDGRTTPNQSEDVNRCMQKLMSVNDHLHLLARKTEPVDLVEQLFKESYKFSLKTHNTLQKRSLQRLAEYLIQEGKAQEALVLCDLVGTNVDTEENTARLRFAPANPIEQLRIKALQALGRNAEANQMVVAAKAEREKKAQLNLDRNVDSVMRQVEKAPPYSTERIQSRVALVASLLDLNSKEGIEKAKLAFLENVNDISSEKFVGYNINIHRDLSSQLTAILSKAAEPDLDFATKAYEALLELRYTKSSKVFQNQGTIERSFPLASTLDNSTFAKNPKIYMTLLRTLTRFCREHKVPDDINVLILLRKLAELESKAGETESAVKTNSEILALLDKEKNVDRGELVRQLLALANAEASASKVSLAKKYQQRAAGLNFVAVDEALVNRSLVNLANQYARQGALREARATLFQVAKRQLDQSRDSQVVSTRELVRACEKQKNFSEAIGFFEDVIDNEKTQNASSVLVDLYRLDFADLLLVEYGSTVNSSEKDRLFKQSDLVFQKAADGLIAAQGQNSRSLGTGVQRRAFQLALNGFREQSDALLEKYRGPASNAGGVVVPIDTNVGSPPL